MIGEGPQPHVGKMEKSPSGRTWHGENSGSKWRGLGVVQKVFGLCAVPCGIEDDEPLKARREGHERAVEHVENHRHAGKKEKCGTENATGWNVTGRKRITRK